MLTFLLSSAEIYERGLGYFTGKLALVEVGGSSDIVYIGSAKRNVLGYYLGEGLPSALGYSLYALSALALLAGLIRCRKKYRLVFALTVIIYILVMGRGSIGAARYLFPILPLLFLLVADLLETLGRLSWLPKRLGKVLCLVILALAAFPAARMAHNNNLENRRKSTKDLAQEWIFRNLPPGSRIAVESMGYRGPDLKLTPVIDYWIYNLEEEELMKLLEERLQEGQPSIALKYFIQNPPHPKFHTDTIYARTVVDLDNLREERFQYIVTCSGIKEIYSQEITREKYPEHYLSRQQFYGWLEEDGEVIKLFSPDRETPGEEIRIYKITGVESE